jgi:hypothetical protein
LNDPQFVEASRALAWRIVREGGATVRDRAAYAIRVVTSRRPDRRERMVLEETFAAQLEAFRASPESAIDYLKVGSFEPDGEYDPAELAAWSTIASMLLNLDETVTKG